MVILGGVEEEVREVFVFVNSVLVSLMMGISEFVVGESVVVIVFIGFF